MSFPKPKKPPTGFDLFRDEGMLFLPTNWSTRKKHEQLAKRFRELCDSKKDAHRLDKYWDEAEELFVIYIREYDSWNEMQKQAKKMKASKSMKLMKPVHTNKAMKRSKLVSRAKSFLGKTCLSTKRRCS